MPELAGEWRNTLRSNVSPSFLKQLPKIQQVELYLERKAKAKCTIETYTKALKELAKRADLNDTTAVELAIANYKLENEEPASNRWKNQCANAYKHYCKIFKIQWEEPPHYKMDEKSIQPSSTEKCLMLIASAKGRLSLKINISTQSGLRPCEVTGGPRGLRVRDIHTDTNTITPTSAKGCNARPPIKITPELSTKLQTYIIRNNLKPNDRLFTQLPNSYTSNFGHMRDRFADKTGDQSIKARSS